jgi:hypothetical protein
LISSIVGTANEIAVSTVAGVATLSFPAAGIIIPAASPAGNSLTVLGAAGAYTEYIHASSSSGSSYGLLIDAGTTAVDAALDIRTQNGTTTMMTIFGDGHGVFNQTSGSGQSWDSNGHWVFGTPAAAGSTVTAGAFAANGSAAFVNNSSNSLSAAFLDENTVHASLVMNSAGANYGTIGNVTTQVWGLGSSNTIGSISSGGTIALQWGATGGVTINAPTVSANSLTVLGPAGSYTAMFQASSSAGNSYGPIIEAGTNASDDTLLVYNQAVSTLFFQIRGDGLININTVQLTISNVSGGTNIPLVINAPVGNWGEEIIGSSTTGSSYGLLIEAGTNASDFALYVGSQGNTHQLFQVRGDGSINCYNPTGGFLGAGTINVFGGYYINGVNQLYQNTFIATFACGGANPTGTAHYSVAGDSVTITWPAVLGAGSAGSTTLSISGIPAAIQPVRSQFVPLGSSVVENGGVIPSGGGCFDMLFNASSGTVNIYQAGSASAFAGATNRGFANAVSTTYQLS